MVWILLISFLFNPTHREGSDLSLRDITNKSELILIWQVKSYILLVIYKNLQSQFKPSRHIPPWPWRSLKMDESPTTDKLAFKKESVKIWLCSSHFLGFCNHCCLYKDLHVLPETVIYSSGMVKEPWGTVDYSHSQYYNASSLFKCLTACITR